MCLQNWKFVALLVTEIIGGTRKMGSPWIRPRSLNFLHHFNGLLFGWTLWMFRPNLQSVALPIPEIIGGYLKNLGSPRIRPRSLFSKIFHGHLFGLTLLLFWPNLKYVSLPAPEIIAIWVLRIGVTNPQSWGREDHRVSGMVPLERALVSSYRPSIVK